MNAVIKTSQEYFASSFADASKLKLDWLVLLFDTPNVEVRIRKEYNLQIKNKHQINYCMILAVWIPFSLKTSIATEVYCNSCGCPM